MTLKLSLEKTNSKTFCVSFSLIKREFLPNSTFTLSNIRTETRVSASRVTNNPLTLYISLIHQLSYLYNHKHITHNHQLQFLPCLSINLPTTFHLSNESSSQLNEICRIRFNTLAEGGKSIICINLQHLLIHLHITL